MWSRVVILYRRLRFMRFLIFLVYPLLRILDVITSYKTTHWLDAGIIIETYLTIRTDCQCFHSSLPVCMYYLVHNDFFLSIFSHKTCCKKLSRLSHVCRSVRQLSLHFFHDFRALLLLPKWTRQFSRLSGLVTFYGFTVVCRRMYDFS